MDARARSRPLADSFALAMQVLGPFEPRPPLAVAVSGGADSLCLALLASDWARQRHGTVRALVVDHRLRAESAEEARQTVERLESAGIAVTLLPLTGLRRGPGLAERARIMRYQALLAACRAGGLLHLLLGHHAADQAETMMMRVLGGSLTHGLAAMPALAETPSVRLLRPLLAIDPAALRDDLRVRGVAWVEDPSNRDLHALRPRLRHNAALHLTGDRLGELAVAARTAGLTRAREEAATAAELAQRVAIRPEGFALLSPGRIGAPALAALIQTIGGAAYPPSLSRIAGLAACPQPATVAGVRLMPAGRMGDGFLVVREEAAIAGPVPAEPDTIWDGRFRLVNAPVAEAEIGKLGDDSARVRQHSSLPAAVLRTLPAVRRGKKLAAVPHLHYVPEKFYSAATFVFAPRKPMAGADFVPM